MTKKIKILAASDIEGDSGLVKKLAIKAEKEKVDLVVLCGDITNPIIHSKDIIKPFKDKKKEVILLPGNWDSFATADILANIYGVKNIHGYSIIHEGIGFFGAGGAVAPGPGQTNERELMKTLEKAHKGLGNVEKKIMLTHMHPSSSLSEFSGFKGSRAITRAIRKFKPDVLLHGHIHEAAGADEKIGRTRVINTGPEGIILEI